MQSFLFTMHMDIKTPFLPRYDTDFTYTIIYEVTHTYARQMRSPKFAGEGNGFVFLVLVLAQDRHKNLYVCFNVEFPLVYHIHVRNWYMIKNL